VKLSPLKFDKIYIFKAAFVSLSVSHGLFVPPNMGTITYDGAFFFLASYGKGALVCARATAQKSLVYYILLQLYTIKWEIYY
jgi:hypothetical protein